MSSNDPIDQEKPKAQDQQKIKFITDLVMIAITVLIIVLIAQYYLVRTNMDSYYIPKYAIDYAYRFSAYKVLILAGGLLLCQVFRIFGKHLFALLILCVFLLFFFLSPWIFFGLGI